MGERKWQTTPLARRLMKMVRTRLARRPATTEGESSWTSQMLLVRLPMLLVRYLMLLTVTDAVTGAVSGDGMMTDMNATDMNATKNGTMMNGTEMANDTIEGEAGDDSVAGDV